jgi:AraC-like DNA-binding protein
MDEYAKRGYLLENFRLFHLRTEKTAQVDFHYHEFCKLLLLVSGQGAYAVDGQRYLLQPGDAVLIGSRSVHRPELDQNYAYERIIIYISPEYLSRVSTKDCDLTQIFSGQQGHVLRLSQNGRKRLFDLAAELEAELSSQEYGREILSNTALLRLLVEVGRRMQRKDSHAPQAVIPRNSRVLDIMRYLDAHLEEDLDIDTLAEAFFVSKFHMMRLFHRETGMTVHNYLTQRRLLRAKDLIANGMRATEACYRSGFRSYSSFTRAYGQHFGTTPTGRMDSTREREESYE